MPDGGGISGLDLSEIGAAAKQAGGAVKKVANPFLQAAKSQLTGSVANSQKGTPVKNLGLCLGDFAADIKSQAAGIVSGQPTEADIKKQQTAKPPNENSPTGGTFDIAGFAKSLKQQMTGGSGTPAGQQPQGGFKMPVAAAPPGDVVSKLDGFDAKDLPGAIGKNQISNNVPAVSPQISNEDA